MPKFNKQDFKSDVNYRKNEIKKNIKTAWHEMVMNNATPAKKLYSKFLYCREDIRQQFINANIHNSKDFFRFIKSVYAYFPVKLKSIIRGGLIASAIIMGLFVLIGIFSLSISKIITGIILGAVVFIATDILAVWEYPNNKTFRN